MYCLFYMDACIHTKHTEGMPVWGKGTKVRVGDDGGRGEGLRHKHGLTWPRVHYVL